MDNLMDVAGHKVKSFAAITDNLTAERTTEITEELIYRFANMTGDANPLHTDPEFGKQTPFQQINAQGQLMSSLIVGVIGSELPGPGWFCLGVNADFIEPCFAGDVVVAGVRVRQRMEALNVVVWEGYVKRMQDEKLITRVTIKTKYMF